MCGIAGCFGSTELPEGRLRQCLDRMRHRGPDHQAHARFRTRSGQHLSLLHARLSILDLDDRSNQPFQLGQFTMVYNGELYNYLELRAELEQRGEPFHTASDTEVLLRVIQRDGWAGLDRCEGMWAFAVYDSSSETLTLGRDRFGEKPVYLLETQSQLFFGSEVKFLSSLAGRQPAVNIEHLQRFLVNGYKALHKTRQTFFEEVRELPPASLLHVTAAGSREEGYWRPRFAQEEMSFAEAVAGTRERLLRAVELRLRADVPLAFCMSGGIDSNALIATARRVFDHDVHGFTIVSEDERYDERRLVEAAVGELGLRHSAVPLRSKGFLEDLRELVRHHEAPVYTLSYFAHWRLMQSIASAGYRISISGTAADELFTGYYDHHLAYLYEVRGDPAQFEAARAAWEAHVLPHVRNPYLRRPELFIANPAERRHIYLQQEVFASRLHEGWIEPFTERNYSASLLRNRMLNELFEEVVPVILHEDDLNAMYFSIENRSPFLDRELFEFSLRIPTRHLVRDGKTKAVLREAIRGIAPDCIVDNRRKVGFNAPILELLNVEDPAIRQLLLEDSPIFDIVRRESLEPLLGERHFPNSESKFLFNFLNAKLFLEQLG